MKKITETQKYAILWLNHVQQNTKEIAKILKINEQQIIEVIESSASQKASSNPNIMKKLMITESVGQKHQVAIMTKAASEVGDQQKQKLSSHSLNKDSCIYKPTSK